MIIFEDKDCLVSTYALAAVATFGMEVLDWDPLIVRDAFESKFNCKLSQRAFDKLMAGLTMLGTDAFTSTIEGFLTCTNACANKPQKEDLIPYVTLKDCCWAVFMYNLMLGEDSQKLLTYDPDIILYIQLLMKVDGISKLPLYMSFAKLNDADTTRIQLALVTDEAAFSAYNIRQSNLVSEILTYVQGMQRIMADQLKELKALGIVK